MEEKYSLYSEFDLEQHKKKYPHYLEVIIGPEGEVMYAVPSHQYKLMDIACRKFSVDRKDLEKMCPYEYWFDYTRWLCSITDCIAVWEHGIQYYSVNHKQMATLRRLKMAGVYTGQLPNVEKLLNENNEILENS